MPKFELRLRYRYPSGGYSEWYKTERPVVVETTNLFEALQGVAAADTRGVFGLSTKRAPGHGRDLRQGERREYVDIRIYEVRDADES